MEHNFITPFNAHQIHQILHTCVRVCIRGSPVTEGAMPLTTVGKWTVLYGVVAIELATLAAAWRLWDNLNRRPGRHAPLFNVLYINL